MSSIYDKSSLVLIPSGTKTGKVYSQKPVSGDGDFTFTRSSAATRVNADGNIEKETQNLLLQSNTFSNAVWVDNAGSCTRTSGQAGYDGTNDAWLLTQDTAGYDNIIQSVSSSGVNTYSIYAKGTSTAFTLRIANTGDRVLFNLSTGSVASTFGSNLIDYGMTDVGGGWYRCYLTANATITSLNIYPYFNSTTATSVTIQDAQLNQGLIAQEVITTTTSAVYGGITDNVPRLDYTDASCPSLLLEPQRTNLLSHSEYISGLDSNTTTTFNYGESPEGFDNSIKVEVNSNGYAQKAQVKGGLTANTTYTFSFWLSSESDAADMRIYDNSNGANIVASTALTIPDSGWKRVTQTFTTPTGCTSIIVYCLASGGRTAGDVTITWGWQLEAGSYATSYIPTYGSSVTRVQDYNSATNISNLIGQTEGTLFVEFDHYQLATSNFQRNFVLAPTGSDSANRISIIPHTSNNNKFYITIRYASTNIEYVATTSSGNLKIAIGYKSGDSAIYVNGTQVFSSVTAFAFTETLNRFSMDSSDLVKQALVFKTRLSNEELAALTTI